jgi:hypothetical protein
VPVLRCRRDDFRVGDQLMFVNLVTVIEQSAWSFSAAVTDARARNDFDRRLIRHFILVNDAQGFIAGVQNFDAAHDDAPERVAAFGGQASLARGLTRQRRQLVEIQVIARHRPGKVRAATFERRMQGV